MRIHSVVVADDHPIFRKGLIEILTGIPSIQIVDEANDGMEAYQKILSKRPDIAVLDIEMPYLTGLDVCKKVLNEKSETKFIVLTMHKEKDFYTDAMAIGVMGYVLKDNAITELVECIRKVIAGEKYTSPGLDKILISNNKREEIPAELLLLTPTEKIVLKLLIDKNSSEIAQMLFISVNTVENHRANIIKKLGLEGKNSLLKYAIMNQSHL